MNEQLNITDIYKSSMKIQARNNYIQSMFLHHDFIHQFLLFNGSISKLNAMNNIMENMRQLYPIYDIPNFIMKTDAEFETVSGWNIRLKYSCIPIEFNGDYVPELLNTLNQLDKDNIIDKVINCDKLTLYLEHKETFVMMIRSIVGDEYPSILSAIKKISRHKHRPFKSILLLETFNSKSVRLEDFLAIFEQNKIHVQFLSEITDQV
jgi:hypothetical protein